MLTTLEITNLRGIHSGALGALAELTVLVGPNGAGKSTLLDALLIGASPRPGDAIGRSVKRRAESRNGARWLLWKAGDDGPARITVTASDGERREVDLTWQRAGDEDGLVLAQVRLGEHEAAANVRFGPSNEYSVEAEITSDKFRLRAVPDVRLVDPHVGGLNSSLPEVYSRAEERGRADVPKAALRDLVPGLLDVVLLSEANVPVIHLKFAGYTVPATLAGDGVYSLVRLGFELAARPRGLVLVEEPEVHQHPAALRQTARVLVGTLLRGIQIVISTHSLELLDALIAEMSGVRGPGLDKMCVCRLALERGVLRSTQLRGPDLELSRLQIADDLR